jgi:putative ABC transport system permease protein
VVDALQAAFRRLQRRPLRSALTLLVVVLGSLAVTLALNLLRARELTALPSDVFRVISGEHGNNSGNNYQLFSLDDLEKFRKLIPDAAMVEAYSHSFFTFLEYKSQRFKLLGSAHVNPNFINLKPLEMLQGTFFNSKDVQAGTPPIVLSQSVAKLVFAEENPLGKTVKLTPKMMSVAALSFETYTVTGVFRDPPDNGYNADYAYVPFGNSSSRFGDDPLSLMVKAKPGLSRTAQAQALEATRKIFKDDDLFKEFNGAVFTSTGGDPFETNPGLDPQALLFAGFAIIMLITCSIGIFSIQLVDISERTREIGMRRALGATRSNIVLEVLTSSFVLAGSGAIMGVLLAAPALSIIKNVTGSFLFSSGLEFSPIVALEVVAIVLVVGVMLGFYPALLASRLKPVEALREM